MRGTDLDKDIPLLARRTWQAYRSATKDLRDAEETSIGFWVGGDHQWRPEEVASRRANNQPITTINRVAPAVDQVENQAAGNPPGPEADPVGGGADIEDADIVEGIIREYEYRSNATAARITAFRYALAGGSGVWELGTEYVDENSWDMQLIVKAIHDPAACFHDVNAVAPHREDSLIQGRIRVLSEDQIREQYPGARLKIFERNAVERHMSWMGSVTGLGSDDRQTLADWTGGSGKGPYYVCELYRVVIESDTLTLYDDGISRFKDDPLPAGVKAKVEDGEPVQRPQPRRKVMKHVVTALDEIIEPIEWPGTIIPLFWIFGPEIRLRGKIHRKSLITGAIGAQQSLNYTATSMNQIVGLMTKAPWTGWEGQFDVTNAQGFNPWESSTRPWAFLEAKPIWTIPPDDRAPPVLLPPPQRNTWEAPIARLFEALTFWLEQIKAATSVYFDPSSQTVADVQSGEAIKELQTQTNMGTFNWHQQLRSAVQLEYQQAAIIIPKIMSARRVVQVVRPDGTAETAEINRIFGQDGIDPKTGKKGKTHNLQLGKFSLRVTAGPDYQTRNKEAMQRLIDVLKVIPGIVNAPAIASMIVRVFGEGSPEIEQIADAIAPKAGADLTAGQLQQQLTAAQQKVQLFGNLLMRAQQTINAKLPQLEQQRYSDLLKSATQIAVAHINASKDADRADADRLEQMLEAAMGMAHEAGMAAMEHQHSLEQIAAAPQPQEVQQNGDNTSDNV